MKESNPKNLYELVTLNMEQRFADRVSFRWYDAAQDAVVEKKYRESAQDIRRAVNYFTHEVPDIKGKRICMWSNNSYQYAINCYGVMLAGGVIVPLNQRKSWEELQYELEMVEPSLILTDGEDYGCNEQMQNAFRDYFDGTIDIDAAKKNFETAIMELYPELTEVVWPE